MNSPSESTAIWNRQPRILVIGLGDSLLRDDGIGVHAVRCFQRVTPNRCLAAEIGTSIFDAIPMLESASRVLAFNAVEAGGRPGSVYLLRAEDILQGENNYPLQEMGLIKALRLLRRPPAEVVIIGAEPQSTDWGAELSPVLDSAIPVMVATALEVIARWRALDLDEGQKVDLASISHSVGSGPFFRTSDPQARIPGNAR